LTLDFAPNTIRVHKDWISLGWTTWWPQPCTYAGGGGPRGWLVGRRRV